MKNEHIVWGIHAGKYGEADDLFLKHKFAALGWREMGDLSKLSTNREAFKVKVAEVYPDVKPGAIPNYAGQLFRFVHEMDIGNFIIYPSKVSRKINIGEITSGYSYDQKPNARYPHHRQIKWLKQSISRTNFSQGALYEIGSALSLFQVRNYADEFTALLEGKILTPPDDDVEEVSLVADEIKQSTNDFIIKRFSKDLKGHPFAGFVEHLLNSMGYKTRLSPPGPDKGIDIIAHKDELGLEPPIIKVQVKSTEDSIGAPEVQALYGSVSIDEKGLFITLGDFSNQAKNFAAGKSNLRLINGAELVSLVYQYYDKFDSRYKGLIPLKQVYIPEPIDEE